MTDIVELSRMFASVSAAYAVSLDIGVRGAIAGFTESGQLLWLQDMPVTREANGRHATNAPLLSGILAPSHAHVAYAEFVAARPTDAKAAAFSFGRAKGIIEGVCGALAIPIVWITPPVWKRLADIPPGQNGTGILRPGTAADREVAEPR